MRLIELARQPDAEALVQRIHARKAATGSSLPADRILSHRDEDRPRCGFEMPPTAL